MKNPYGDVIPWPRPQEMRAVRGTLSLARPLTIVTRGKAEWLQEEAEKIVALLNRAAGRNIARIGKSGVFVLASADAVKAAADRRLLKKPESYLLTIAPRGISLMAGDAAGAFYGAQTLAQMRGATTTAQ